MFDFLVTAIVIGAGIFMLCMMIFGFVKAIELFLNQFDDRDPWK